MSVKNWIALVHAEQGKTFLATLLSLLGISLAPLLMNACNGKAVELHNEGSIGNSVIGDGGGSRTDGADLGSIYTVTKVVEATQGIPGWGNADMPLDTNNYPVQNLGSFTLNTQTPFHFSYTYPANNYKLSEGHVVIVTARDNSDTEGIFVDGVLTGRLPANAPSTSTRITHRYYTCSGSCTSGGTPSTPSNTYYMTWSLSHYKASNLGLNQIYKQMIDLRLADLLTPTTLTEKSVLNDGQLNVVAGDDSPIYQALLFFQGYTISKTALTCTNSSTYNFENVYVHNDGNSISSAAFSGTVKSPVNSWGTSRASDQSVEFYFDPKFPSVSSLGNITVTEAKISFRTKRDSSGNLAAIVINGLGVSQSGFNRSLATGVVESWVDNSTSNTYWANFVNSVAATETDTSVTLDLVSMLGASTVRDLISQGKFNISIYGGLSIVYGQAATSTRTFGTQVAGPELTLKGTFYTQVCEVPNNSSSPLTDDNPLPAGGLDETSPVVTSVQAAEITSTSAVIQWLTDEGADSQVEFGLTDPPTGATTLDATYSTFHRVQLTGLSPFKYYFYRVKSKDSNGNSTTYATKVFRTLR